MIIITIIFNNNDRLVVSRIEAHVLTHLMPILRQAKIVQLRVLLNCLDSLSLKKI